MILSRRSGDLSTTVAATLAGRRRHISDMYGIRSNPNLTAFAGFRSGAPGGVVGDWTVHDLTFRQILPAEMVMTASVNNVFDKDPPLARLDLIGPVRG